MFECMGEGLYAIDKTGHVLLINPAACQILGYRADELIGKVMHEATHYKHLDGSSFPKKDCAGFKVISDGETVIMDCDYFIRKDGSFIPVSYASSPIYQDSKISGAVVVFQDISSRLQQDAALRKAEQHLRLIYRELQVGTWEWELDSDILSFSPEFAKLTGLSEVNGLSLKEFVKKTIFYDSDRKVFETTLQQALRSKREFKAELRIRRDGSARSILISGKSFYNRGRTTVLGMLLDTTDLKRRAAI
jgi:PAS domain S-box-containing protein